MIQSSTVSPELQGPDSASGRNRRRCGLRQNESKQIERLRFLTFPAEAEAVEAAVAVAVVEAEAVVVAVVVAVAVAVVCSSWPPTPPTPTTPPPTSQPPPPPPTTNQSRYEKHVRRLEVGPNSLGRRLLTLQ